MSLPTPLCSGNGADMIPFQPYRNWSASSGIQGLHEWGLDGLSVQFFKKKKIHLCSFAVSLPSGNSLRWQLLRISVKWYVTLADTARRINWKVLKWIIRDLMSVTFVRLICHQSWASVWFTLQVLRSRVDVRCRVNERQDESGSESFGSGWDSSHPSASWKYYSKKILRQRNTDWLVVDCFSVRTAKRKVDAPLNSQSPRRHLQVMKAEWINTHWCYKLVAPTAVDSNEPRWQEAGLDIVPVTVHTMGLQHVSSCCILPFVHVHAPGSFAEATWVLQVRSFPDKSRDSPRLWFSNLRRRDLQR